MVATEKQRHVKVITPELDALFQLLEPLSFSSAGTKAEIKDARTMSHSPRLDPIRCLFSPYFSNAIPYAEIRAKADKVWKPGHWLCADPLIFQADLKQVICLGQAPLTWSEAEAKRAFTRLERLVNEDGYELYYGSEKRWYLYSKEALDIESTAAFRMSSTSVDGHWPKGVNAQYFIRLMTESQMLFQDLSLVQALRSRGLVAILGPWFWGEGESAQVKSAQEETLWSEPEFLLETMADCVGLQWRICPSEADDWLQALEFGNHSVLLESEDKMSRWLPVLVEATKQNKINELELVVSEKRSIILSRSTLLPWWRRLF